MSWDRNEAIRDAITTTLSNCEPLYRLVMDAAREAVVTSPAGFDPEDYAIRVRRGDLHEYGQEAGVAIRDLIDTRVRGSRWDGEGDGWRQLVLELFAVLGTDDWDRIGEQFLPGPETVE